VTVTDRATARPAAEAGAPRAETDPGVPTAETMRPSLTAPRATAPASSESGSGRPVLMKGNEAMAEAAIAAGCDAYFGYPITPQAELLETMARRMPELGREPLRAR
jgi:hypothetical protein